MRHPLSHAYPYRALGAAAVVALTLGLAACDLSSLTAATTPTSAATATPRPTATPTPHASVVRVSKTQHFADSKSGGTSSPCANGDPLINGDCGVTVSVACPAGEPVLSGGFAVDDFLAFVSSTYPSSASAWTLTVHDEGQDGGSHPVTVTAYADCLKANFTAATPIASSAPSIPADHMYHTVTQSCPAGTTLTGGGFRGSDGSPLSIPSGNSWKASLAPSGAPAPKIFAVCVKGHLAAAGTPSAAKTFAIGVNGTVSVACAAGKLLVGGGGKGDNGSGAITSNAATNDVSHWQLQVRGPSLASGPGATFTATVYGVCVTVA
jgi:hypothetical protein